MRTLCILVILAGIILSGCATMAETPSERDERIKSIWAIQARQMVEDWDYLWLVDRPTQLSAYHVRMGLPN